ncbi:MAG: hypothetical protein M5R36_28090 [Deltaproteobacteria bacterium]|nr:hypothetical protein [Deltaproteobacteria bacterium]
MTRPARILAATFLTAAAVLSTEIILTRVFSVLMWYHFAFLAISVCLFGMAVGSLALHLFGRNLREDDLPIHLGRAAIGFAATQFLCVVVLRFLKYGDMNIGAAFAAKMALTFLVCAAPFAFAGFFLGLVFSRGAARIGGIYFADLAGASLGCLLTIALLTHFGGESALLAAAFIALCGGLVAGRISFTRPVFLQQLGAAAVVVALIAANQYTGFLNVRHSKGNDEPEPAAVGWNSFSRVIAYPRPDVGDIMLKIDGIAHTPITPFHGDAAVTQDPAGYIQRVPFAFYDNPRCSSSVPAAANTF